ncbi:MAG: WG repeat-containing protein [Bacteroidales bacterium]|nr:WG repeat-containing protein [Bacteroidales bacterium]
MKRIPIILLTALLALCAAQAQTPAYESSTQKFGYKGDNGAWRINPQFQRAGAFEGGARKWAAVKLDGRWGIIDIDGNLVCRNVFEDKEVAREAAHEWEIMSEPGKWIYPARNPADGRWGYVDYYGRWRFQPVYEAASQHQGKDPKSYATVKKEGRWGCIDGRGVLVINNIFLRQEHAVEAGQQWAIGRNYYKWRIATTHPQTGLWGYADYLGRWAVQPQYSDAAPFGDNHLYDYAQVKQEGRWGNIGRDGEAITTPIFFSREEAAYALRQYEHGRALEAWRFPVSNPADGKWGWVDWSGEWRIQPQFEAASHFANDTGLFATAKYDGYWMVIGDTGEFLSRNVFNLSSEAWTAGHEWDTDQELGHWLYPIMDPGTQAWGYVDYMGQWVIKPTLEDAKLFTFVWNDRVAPAKMDGKWGCIDHTGQFVVKNIYNTSAEAAVAGRRWAEGKKF